MILLRASDETDDEIGVVLRVKPLEVHCGAIGLVQPAGIGQAGEFLVAQPGRVAPLENIDVHLRVALFASRRIMNHS